VIEIVHGKRWAFLGASLVLAVLTQEALLRAVVPQPELASFSRLRYAPPQIVGTDRHSLARRALWWISEPDGAAFVRYTNLYGFRDGEWRTRPGGEPRVAVFGDSFVEGLGAPDGGTIVDFLRRRARESGNGVELMSFGAAGFGTEELWILMADAVELFRFDHVVLVLYVNDLFRKPPHSPPPPPTPRPRRRPLWWPRLAYAIELRSLGEPVPTRWREPAGEPRPLEVAPRLERDPSLVSAIESQVDPEVAAAMLRGTLNPAVTNHLRRSERELPRGVDAAPFLRALERLAADGGARLYVVYLPSLNQVSDRYLPAQRRLSAPMQTMSLTGHDYQQQARDLGDACRRAGLPFLDLTPHLARLEERGESLYWPHDGHMNAIGYAAVAEAMARRWLDAWAAP
jgi:lysophospholipase L1-like esterase